MHQLVSIYVYVSEKLCIVQWKKRWGYIKHNECRSWNNYLVFLVQKGCLGYLFSIILCWHHRQNLEKTHLRDCYYSFVKIDKRLYEDQGLCCWFYVKATFFFFPCFLISSPITGVTFNVIKFLQTMIRIVIANGDSS